MAKHAKGVTTYVLDNAEIREILDREAPQRLGMTGEQFIDAYFGGTLPDLPAATELAMLVKLSEDTIRSTIPTEIR